MWLKNNNNNGKTTFEIKEDLEKSAENKTIEMETILIDIIEEEFPKMKKTSNCSYVDWNASSWTRENQSWESHSSSHQMWKEVSLDPQ